jgi:tetratricopeptide (TPR) repeat protein
MLGRAQEALQVTEQAILLAQETNALLPLSSAWANKAYIHVFRGEFDAAGPAWQRAVEISEHIGDLVWITIVSTWQNRIPFYLGAWAQVRKNMEQPLAMSQQLGESWGSAYVFTMLGMVDLVEGHWSAARRYLEEAVTIAARIGDTQALRWATGSVAELEVLEGQAGAGRARLVPLLDRPGQEEFDVTAFLPVLAWAYLELGDLKQADSTVQAAIRRARAEQLRVVLVDALRIEALLRIRQGRRVDAGQVLEAGLALARATPYPHAEARLQVVYGSLYDALGEAALAREQLVAALAIFRRLGARKDFERAEQVLSALG